MAFLGFGRRNRRDREHSVRRDAAFSALILFGLALPFLPWPGDRMTRIAVKFQTGEMQTPENFTTRTTHTICTALSAALSYTDPASGEYIRIDCGRRNSAPSAEASPTRRPITLAGAEGIEPATVVPAP